MMDSIIRAYINFIKHGVRNSTILCAAIALVFTLVISLIMEVPIWSVTALIIIGGFTVLGAIVGALVALLFIKIILPQMGINYSMLETPANNQLIPEGKIEMDIDYKLTTEDVTQFLLYYYDHSPRRLYIRKLKKWSLIFITFVALLAAIVLLVFFDKQFLAFVWTLCGVALLTFIYLIVSPSLLRKAFKRTVVKAYSREKNKLMGKHKVSIFTDGITDVTDTGETTTRWNAIDWIATADHYLFITAQSSIPYIIPASAFKDKTFFLQFVQKAQSYYKASKENI